MAFIRLDKVSVDFPIYGMSTRSLKKELVRFTTGGAIRRDDSQVVVVKALNNISLEIADGTRVGLIGHNGAGKSTLLRLLAGIYEPSSGHVHVEGQVTALLDVSLGIDAESTGYENITLRGMLHGLTRQQIKSKQQEIAEFTDLGDYLNMPIRTYSSGMQVRLAFAIATSIHPQILALDEAVGAGDAAFMQKAKQRLSAMMDKAEIVVLASHDSSLIQLICDKVIWMEAGKIVFFGDADEGAEIYEQSLLAEAQ